ncbi:MAG: hypothetical protein AB7T59_08960 [Hyphomonadaceae bacterium]
MRFGLAALALAFAAPALAQPLPDTIRSAGLTRAQADELNRRLGALQTRFSALAGETQLREAAVRNIAVEIFGARPDLDFDTYAGLIDTGARELRTLLTEARSRTESDPELAALRTRAIALAEEGRLSEARALYDQLIARTTETLEARWAREDLQREAERRAQTLAVAADMAEAARLAFVAADFRDSARRYGEAAARAPADSRERWRYTVDRANALRDHAGRFGDAAALREAIGVYQDEALPMAPRASKASEWAETQTELGTAFIDAGERGDFAAIQAGISAFRSALAVHTRGSNPVAWSRAQNRLGFALRILADTTGAPATYEEAAGVLRAALEVRTREANRDDWAASQANLATVLVMLGDSRADQNLIREAIAINRAVLDAYAGEPQAETYVVTLMNLSGCYETLSNIGDSGARALAVAAAREVIALSPRELYPYRWAQAQSNLASYLMGSSAGPEALEEAITRLSDASSATSRQDAPELWAALQNNLGIAYRELGSRRGDRAAFVRSAAALRAALEARPREAAPQLWARTQFNLATTLSSLAATDEDQREIIAIHQSTLAVFTREARPMDWARAQVSMAHAGYRIAWPDDQQGFRDALTQLASASEVISRNEHSQFWAYVESTRGYILLALGDVASLREAAERFRGLLEIQSPEQNPVDWATAQLGLANTLRALLGHNEPGAGEAAVAAYRSAVQGFATAGARPQWAQAQGELSAIYITLGASGDAAAWPQALAAGNAALEVITEADASWRSVQYNVGYARARLAQAGDGAQRAPALAALRAARDASAQAGDTYWAEAAQNLISELEATP